MPQYDYECKKCSKKFAVTQSISDHDKKKAKCPKCGSKSLNQVLRGFFAKTSRKS